MKPVYRIVTAILLILLSASASGCAFFMPEAETASSNTVYTPMPVVDSTPAAQITAAPENPVSAFYRAYDQGTALLGGFYSHLTAANRADYLEALMLLSEHTAYMTKAETSVGRLTSDGFGYSGALIGAATGSGSLTPYGSFYRFFFTYDDGSILLGALTDTTLRFSSYAPDGPIRFSAFLQNTSEGWLSCVEAGSLRTVLLVSSAVRFARVAITPSEEVYIPPTPTPAPVSYTHLTLPTTTRV